MEEENLDDSHVHETKFLLPLAKLKGENEELKEQLYELRAELQDEKSHEKHLKREQVVETKILREEERKRAQSMVGEVRRKLYKEKQQEISELKDKLHKEREKEVASIIKHKDEEIRRAQNNWSREKDDLVQKLRVQFANEMRDEFQKSFEKQVVKLENQIEELREQKKQIEESCKLVQEADKRKAEQIRRIHLEHEHELGKLKKDSWKEGRKQMAEIRQLTNIIHQLEKKLGVESGHYIRLQMEKESLRDKLDRVKGTDSPGRRSPLFTNSDLTSDLSFFSFPSMDDSNPLWLQLKQQRSTIAQLKQNLQDKNRRIDLLKQKLLKNKSRLGAGGLLHRSMDDLLSYDTATDRDDCISPQFAIGYSTGSSGASSVNDDSIHSYENQETEIIRKLRKELLTLEKAYSFLQAETGSSLDAKRNNLEREQLQSDLIDATQKIDELNKELVESRDRNDLFEFQLQESLQGNENEDYSGFNIPILRIDYEFTDDELECSAEEVKVKLEELENEKKPLLNRDEQLALLQARILIDTTSKVVAAVEAATQCDIMKMEEPGGSVIIVTDDNSRNCLFRKVVESGVPEMQPFALSDFDEELIEDATKGAFVSEQNKSVVVSHDALVQTDFLEFGEVLDKNETETAVQCEIMKMKMCNDVETIEIHDANSKCCRFRKVLESRDIAVQSNVPDAVRHTTGVLPEKTSGLEKLGVHDHVEVLGIDSGVQCNIVEIKCLGGNEVLDILYESGNWRFRKVAESRDSDAQTDFLELNDDVVGEKASETDEENVEEKHVCERSEKSLVCAEKNWKDFVVERELRGVTTPLDCVVYEKEDVLVVICESSRRFYKEAPNGVTHVDGEQVSLCNSDDDIFAKNESSQDDVRKDVEKLEVGIQCNMLEEVQMLVTEPTDHPVDALAKFSSPVSFPGFYPNYTPDFEQSAFLPGGAEVTQVTREQNLHYSAEADLFNDLDCEPPNTELVRPLNHPDRRPPFEKTTDGLYRYQSSNITREISTQCPDDSEGSPATETSCLYCGHAKLPAVDCGVQCEFADLLCSVSGITDVSAMTGISSVFQETGDESLIKEVLELAKECSQNDALIDQHLNEVVQSQEFYEEFQEEEAIDVGVQCDMLKTSVLCDQATQCMMDGSDVDVLVTTERGDKEVLCEFYENDDQEFKNVESEDDFGAERLKGVDEEEELGGEDVGDSEENKDQLVYRDLYSEISNSEARDEILDLDNISINCAMKLSGNSENSYDEITAGRKREEIWKVAKEDEFRENVDKAVQCNLLDGGQDTILHRDNSDEMTETLSSVCDKPGPSHGIAQDEAVAENKISNRDVCLEEKETPEDMMFELTSVKLKNQQLIQQIVELKIQAKRERDEDSEVNENKNKQHCGDSSETISVSASFSKAPGFETTVKPTRRREDGSPNRRSIAGPEETEILTGEAIIPKLNIDLDNVFREMDGKPTPLVFKVTLSPQPDHSFQPIREETSSSAASDNSDDFTRDNLGTRLAAEEPTISRTCAAGSLHVLDESLRGFNEEIANGINDDDVSSTQNQSERSIKSLDQVDREGTGKEHLAPRDFNTQLEQEPFSSLSSAQSPSLSADNSNFTEDNSEGLLPPLPTSDPPPIPNSLPPSLSPSGYTQEELDADIEALLAEEGAGMIKPAGVVRSTLDHEVEALLESESSSVTSEPDTVLSMDSLCVTRDPGPSRGSPETSDLYHDTHDDDTEVMTSFERDDVISPTADDSSVEALINEAPPQAVLSMESKPQDKSSNRHVSFHHRDFVSDSSSASAECDQRRKQPPPPVFPKPKYRSLSMSIPPSELPSLPAQNTDNGRLPSSSMAAQRDMIDGYFPPPGLVPKRANEFNSGEYDLLKERIAFLERQLKNKENLLQSMRAEATEIETNAYIQKKEQDLKMMDESVRFLKLENQKKERELIAKIGELNKCNFELEQWKSERASSEKHREKMEETLDSQRAQLNHLQTVDAQFQELKCKYSTLECANAEQQEKINRLHRADEEFIELERVISDLQAKLKELGEVKRERDEFSEQLKAIKTQTNDLVHKGRKVETERNDFLMNNKLMEQQKENLEARNKALQRTNDTFKTKISGLEKECRDSQRKFFDVQRERDEGSSQLRKMEAERNELRKRVNELLEYKSNLKQTQSKCHDFECEVGYLQAQCKKLETERTELASELSNCLKERNRLEGQAGELEQLSSGNAKLEEKFHTLKIKVAELTSQRDDAEVQLPTLKAKVALLKKACKEKDEQLEKMKEETRELKHSIATSAIDDLSKIQSFAFSSPENFLKFGAGLDTNNNNTTQATLAQKSRKGEKYVVLFDYDPSRLSTTGHPEKELKLNEGDVITVFGDMDMSGYYMAELNGVKGLVSSLYVEAMEEYDVRKMPKRRGLQSEKSPPKQLAILVSPPKTSTVPPELVKRQFVAIRDYNPSTSSTSGRPDLEIPLTAGEMVTVVGDVDANGYYTVEKRGKLAIIPSNLVKPSSPSLVRPSKVSFSGSSQKTEQAPQTLPQPSVLGSSTMDSFSGHVPSHFSVPSKPLTAEVPLMSTSYGLRSSVENLLHTQNYETSGESRETNGNMSSGLQPSQNELTGHVRHSSVENVSTRNYGTVGNSRDMNGNMSLTIQPGLPAPPRNLRVLRCVNRDALLLGWVGPEIDEMGRNNGQLIKGYRILGNGQSKLDVDSPYMAKALVENLDLSRLNDLSIQTVADNGFCSEKSSTQFNEAIMQETTSVTTKEMPSLDDGSPFKTYVALYSYDPTKNSPNPNPTFELEFQEGDIVRIFDVSRADGFYMGQVGGKQGLVPSNFIEEIAVAARPKMQLKYSKEKDFHGSNASLVSNSSSTGSRKGKVVVALYDYDPSTQSPNGLSGRELSFRKGQIIRVYGPMRSDGFYEADINGEKGLVPSSFLKEGKRKSSKSAHPTSSYASLPRRVQFVNQQGTRQPSAGYV